MGVDTVRARMHLWVPDMTRQAIQWLSVKDRETREREAISSSEQMALAREANSIARAASDSAKRSADAARTSNIIASAALIAAMIAIVVSVIGLTHSGAHDETPPESKAAQTH